MLNVELDETLGIAVLEPGGRLSRSDFEAAGKIIDPFIEKYGDLSGIVIHVEHFPGWDSFSALLTHFKFVKEHHKKICRVAFATESPVGHIVENVANHFVKAEIKHFEFQELETAKQWISSDQT